MFHGQRVDGFAAILDDVTDAALDTDLPDDRQDQVLGADSIGQAAADIDCHRGGFVLQQTLGGQYMCDFGRANAKSQRTEGAVGTGMAVAADDGHSGSGQSLFRPDDVHDAPLLGAEVVQLYAEPGAVVL